jgi:hypothetical protein
MTRRWRGWVGAGTAFTGIWSVVAQGQVRQSAALAPLERPVCAGQVISRIDIQTYPPFDSGGTSFAARIAHIATSLHSTTRASVVRRYLALQLGDRCNEFRRRESERILRAQPFIADAAVVAAPDGAGGVVLRVVTVDETSLVLDAGATTHAPVLRSFRLGDQNIGGEGVYAAAGWQSSPFRDVYRGRFVDYQFLGRPYQLAVEGTRDEIGGSWNAEASHPFYTDLQRFSWRATGGEESTIRSFVRGFEAPDAALLFTRSYGDVGGVFAVGPRAEGHHLLLGGTLSREREHTARTPIQIVDSAVVPDTSSALVGRYGEHRSTRVNVLLGYRNVRYATVHGFDAVEGAQDVRTGVQVATLFGRGLRLSDDEDRDYFMSADVYAAHATPGSFTGVEVMTERRRALDLHQWDGELASGRFAWYVHPAPKHTTLVDVEYGGGWRQRVPFQLTFADREGGLRGFATSDLGGAQRLVTRLEERYRFGHVRQFAAVAGAVFVDAGKLWAGDAPFGVNTGVKASVGVSLLAALPPRSRRTWRIDVAHALNDPTSRGIEVRFSNHDFTRWFWREPGDVQWGRERSIPNSIYNWP